MNKLVKVMYDNDISINTKIKIVQCMNFIIVVYGFGDWTICIIEKKDRLLEMWC
jgi:hypothetical protein